MSKSKIDDGGPAFAYVPNQQQMLPNGTWDQTTDFGEPGMSVRMYAAIQIMAGINANPAMEIMPKSKARAIVALEEADALIAAEKEGR